MRNALKTILLKFEVLEGSRAEKVLRTVGAAAPFSRDKGQNLKTGLDLGEDHTEAEGSRLGAFDF